MTLSEKLKQKGLGGVAQVVECLTNKLKSLSSNSSTEKKKPNLLGGKFQTGIRGLAE
jgi:hypothetical protein